MTSQIQFLHSYHKYQSCNINYIICNIHTPCPQKKYHFCILAITTSNLHQIQKGRSVLKFARSEDFKTDLTFDIWPSRSWKNWGQRHQGPFSFFAWICKVLSIFSSCNHSFGLSKHHFDILLYFLWYFHHKWPSFYPKKCYRYWFFSILCWNYSEKWL